MGASSSSEEEQSPRHLPVLRNSSGGALRGEPFGDEYFARLDRRIDEARSAGDRRNEAYLLMIAFRMAECAVASRKLTEDAPDDAWAWHMREKASAVVGDRMDAELAGRRANDLGP